MRELLTPQSLPQISRHAQNAGWKKISLQRCAKMLRRPTAHGSIHGQRWTIHPVSPAQNTRHEAAEQQPWLAIMLQFRQMSSTERINREANDE